jgi:hypothetical protein
MKRVLIVIIALALLVPVGPAQAQDAADSLWANKVIRKQHWRERRARLERQRYLERRRYDARVYGYVRRDDDDDRDRGDRCRDMRRVVGDQGLSASLAQGQADKSWAADVRFHLGERYMDIANAEDIKYECSRSSVGETLGQTFHRCQISAKPCKARKVEAKK